MLGKERGTLKFERQHHRLREKEKSQPQYASGYAMVNNGIH
ncbi:hypothetical protein [Vibrio nigripulchritudo]|nr:hypothetical protein [Vibrio nigripulchritudo]